MWKGCFPLLLHNHHKHSSMDQSCTSDISATSVDRDMRTDVCGAEMRDDSSTIDQISSSVETTRKYSNLHLSSSNNSQKTSTPNSPSLSHQSSNSSHPTLREDCGKPNQRRKLLLDGDRDKRRHHARSKVPNTAHSSDDTEEDEREEETLESRLSFTDQNTVTTNMHTSTEESPSTPFSSPPSSRPHKTRQSVQLRDKSSKAESSGNCSPSPSSVDQAPYRYTKPPHSAPILRNSQLPPGASGSGGIYLLSRQRANRKFLSCPASDDGKPSGETEFGEESGDLFQVDPAYPLQEVREIMLGRSGTEEKFGIKVDRIGEEVYIVMLQRASTAANSGLKIGDRLVRIDDRPVSRMTLDEVLNSFKNCQTPIKIAYKPRALLARTREVTLQKCEGRLGVRLQRRTDVNGLGIYIDVVIPDSPASKVGLKDGDQLLHINGEVVTRWSQEKATKRLKDTPDGVDLTLGIREMLPMAQVRSRPDTPVVGAYPRFHHRPDWPSVAASEPNSPMTNVRTRTRTRASSSSISGNPAPSRRFKDDSSNVHPLGASSQRTNSCMPLMDTTDDSPSYSIPNTVVTEQSLASNDYSSSCASSATPATICSTDKSSKWMAQGFSINPQISYV